MQGAKSALTKARTVAFVVIGLFATAAATAGWAAAGTYRVVQCDPAPGYYKGDDDVVVQRHPSFGVTRGCQRGPDDNAMKIFSTLAAGPNSSSSVSLKAPEGTEIIRARFQAKLRRDKGLKARIFMANGSGAQVDGILTGSAEATPWRTHTWSAGGRGHARFVATLVCDNGTNHCNQTDRAKTWLRSIRLTLRDKIPPSIDLTGDLLDEGWLRGERSVGLSVTDIGSGVRDAAVIVGENRAVSSTYQCATLDGSGGEGNDFATRVIPCEHFRNLATLIESTLLPNGSLGVEACAADFGGPEVSPCARTQIRIDNEPPSLSFFNQQLSEDPELIRASIRDQFSGVGGGAIQMRKSGASSWTELPTESFEGQLRARVDSMRAPAGTYQFRAVGWDRAKDGSGQPNSTTTLLRADGSPMVLDFPLKTSTRLLAGMPNGRARAVVPYRKGSRLTGRLLDAEGTPIAGAEVVVTERFGDHALIDRRVRTVRTARSGRYEAFIPGGPSRRIRVTYEGSKQYSGDQARGLQYLTRGRAFMRRPKRSVKAGKRVTFRGRVSHYAAKLPAGGKTVALQVKEGPGVWNTVREEFRTDEKGRWRFRYRFNPHYAESVRFKFKLKVLSETGWHAYRTPVRSNQRSLRVVPR